MEAEVQTVYAIGPSVLVMVASPVALLGAVVSPATFPVVVGTLLMTLSSAGG